MAQTSRLVTRVPPFSGLGRTLNEWLSRFVVAHNDLGIRHGTGTPEAVVSAPVGTIFLRDDGGAGTVLYVKESGTGNTGWAAK